MNLVAKSLRYWHTLRHLKPVQFYGRLWIKLYRPQLAATPVTLPLRGRQGRWQQPAAREPSMVGPCSFRFLNHAHQLPSNDGWNDAALEKLWLYNLHYFDDLNAAGASNRTAWHLVLMQRWVAENPPAIGNGWEPYPTSLRIVNWVKWALSGNALPEPCARSLVLQARWLQKRLEWHLLGNHLFANAKALVFVGLFFEGPEAQQWLTTGLRIIARELPEQVLSDGGNFERSPMYHAIFLEDLLDLVNAANVWTGQVDAALAESWRNVAGSMLVWLQGMAHPDGKIALFNDAAFGVAPTTQELTAYARRLALSANPADEGHGGPCFLTHWPSSGYIRLENADAVALLDVAPVGPAYLPGHAHADTLSFELSVSGQRVVVNGGTSRYGLGPLRLRERETAAHSTVEVAKQSSSEVWGGFRVARRASPFDLQIQDDAERMNIACSHDGYVRLAGQPVHRRAWTMMARSLLVTDTVVGGRHTAVARYILHPQISIVAAGPNTWELALPDGRSLNTEVLCGEAYLEPAHYAPEFGIVLPTQSLTVNLLAGKAQVEWSWS